MYIIYTHLRDYTKMKLYFYLCIFYPSAFLFLKFYIYHFNIRCIFHYVTWWIMNFWWLSYYQTFFLLWWVVYIIHIWQEKIFFFSKWNISTYTKTTSYERNKGIFNQFTVLKMTIWITGPNRILEFSFV